MGILSYFSKLTFRKKIIAGNVLSLFIFLGFCVYSYTVITEVSTIPLKMYKHPFTVSNSVREINKSLAQIQLNLSELILFKAESTEITTQKINKEIDLVAKNFTLIDERFLGDKTKIQEAKNEFQKGIASINKAIELSKGGNNFEAKEKLLLIKKMFNSKVYSKISYLLEFAKDKGAFFDKKAKNLKEQVLRNMIILTVVLGLLIFLIFKFILDGVEKSLSRVILNISENSLSTKSVSSELSSTSSNLQQTIEQQEDSISHADGAIQSILSIIKNNMSIIQNSKETSKKSYKEAKEGHQASLEMLGAVNSINDGFLRVKLQFEKEKQSLEEITNFIKVIQGKIKVIDNIVFQTKLLSFNASVEAARAGEHGKGFAVVAEEVGNLASVTGNSAKEITSLINESVTSIMLMIQESEQEMEVISKMTTDSLNDGVLKAQDCQGKLTAILKNAESIEEQATQISNSAKAENIEANEVVSIFQSLKLHSKNSFENGKITKELSKEALITSENLHDSLIELKRLIKKDEVTDIQSRKIFKDINKKAA